MTERAEHPETERPEQEGPNTTGPVRVGHLRRARTTFLVAVVCLPPILNAQNIVTWANSPDGLNMPGAWGWIVFGGLDLIAAVCVLETVIQSQLGRKAGAFALLVWAFAGASAYAGYRHGTQADAGRDVKWFFPFMALAGPTLLHLILTRSRKDRQVEDGKRLTYAPALAYGWKRWVPVLGAFGETFCSWRVGHLEGIVRPAAAIDRYRALRPYAGRSGLRVLRALRTEAEHRRPDDQRVPPPPDTAVPDTTARTNSGTPKKANTKTRTAKPDTARPTNGVQSNGTAVPYAERLQAQFGDRRDNPPSVREVAMYLGIAPSTAHPHQKRLLADLAGDDQERVLVGATA